MKISVYGYMAAKHVWQPVIRRSPFCSIIECSIEENIVLVLSSAWHVKHPIGVVVTLSLYLRKSDAYLETSCNDIFMLFLGTSSHILVHLKMGYDHTLSNSPVTVEKVITWLKNQSVYHSIGLGIFIFFQYLPCCIWAALFNVFINMQCPAYMFVLLQI
jgi:hypothetical protein